MKRLFVVLFFISILIDVFGQPSEALSTKEEVKAECQKIMDQFTLDDTNAAFDMLEELWVLFQKDELINLRTQTIKQLNTIEDRFGAIIDSKLIKEESVPGVLYQLNYVMRREKHALRFIFSFYYGKGDKWYLNTFKWDDSITKLLE